MKFTKNFTKPSYSNLQIKFSHFQLSRANLQISRAKFFPPTWSLTAPANLPNIASSPNLLVHPTNPRTILTNSGCWLADIRSTSLTFMPRCSNSAPKRKFWEVRRILPIFLICSSRTLVVMRKSSSSSSESNIPSVRRKHIFFFT